MKGVLEVSSKQARFHPLLCSLRSVDLGPLSCGSIGGNALVLLTYTIHSRGISLFASGAVVLC